MLACSAPPDGCARWTLNLLGERLVELEVVVSISHKTVRQAYGGDEGPPQPLED